MARLISLDPRVTRMNIDTSSAPELEAKPELDQFHTYEVFHQAKTGAHHMHVGIVHAPNADMALVLAKEQYGRRGQTVNIWVVNTRDIIAMETTDSDVFTTTPEKTYRDVGAYMVRNKVEAFKKQQKEG
jgi:ring-1,2-phenylacetyl-CoA epoxidase subunit PaaB